MTTVEARIRALAEEWREEARAHRDRAVTARAAGSADRRMHEATASWLDACASDAEIALTGPVVACTGRRIP